MQPKYLRLVVWALVFNFFFTELRDIVEDGLGDFLDSWTRLKGIMLSLSSLFVFALYAIGAYAVLLYNHKRWIGLKMLLILLVVTLVVLMRYGLEEQIFPAVFGFDNYNDRMSWQAYYWDNLYYAIVFTAVGIVFYSVEFSKFKETQQQALKIQNQKTELAFLRSQMNPHFLFNTMNNIYTLVYQKSENALLAMDKLTSLLRYALYEPAEKVPLKRELAYIDDFVNLQLIRYDYPVQLEIEVDDLVRDLSVPPFSFIAFVENAFKHGNLKDPENPLKIEFWQDGEFLIFSIQNAKQQQLKDQTGGIGLENVKKRLSLIYADQHHLAIQETTTHFAVQLKIPLHLCK